MSQRSSWEEAAEFGRLMLSLREAMRLTQAGLGDILGVSRHTVGAWETGNKYPNAAHLKHFIEVAVQRAAFDRGAAASEIRALWHAGQQKVLLDNAWLDRLLAQPGATATPDRQPHTHPAPSMSAGAAGTVLDWGDALSVPSWYGREAEFQQLRAWLLDRHCRVVGVLGIGGIGKSALAVSLMRDVAAHFGTVIWRSLRDSPSCDDLIDGCLQVLRPEEHPEPAATLEERVSQLLERLRAGRVLLVLDNFETLLAEGDIQGRTRPGFAGYDLLLRAVAEREHQSCLLLTSREKPGALLGQEGGPAPVQTLQLGSLDHIACAGLLAERGLSGTVGEQAQLIAAYNGNPLALKIVAQTIVELFGGDIALFLATEDFIFGGVSQLLDSQFSRLSALERGVIFWLAIMREPQTLAQLRAATLTQPRAGLLLEVVSSLVRRSMVERGVQPGSFTLQSVVLEFASALLVASARDELLGGSLQLLVSHNLSPALSPEYIRQAQERLIVEPLLQQLRAAQPNGADLEARLLALLDDLRRRPEAEQGYAPANIVALLWRLRGDLRGSDLARLALRGAYFQGVEMQDASLAGALLRDCVFSATLDSIRSVAFSADGALFAACSLRGTIQAWSTTDYTLQRTWNDGPDLLFSFAFSQDGRYVLAANGTPMLRLWDSKSGALIWSAGPHGRYLNNVLFTPDGLFVASSSDDGTVRLWRRDSGALAQILSDPNEAQPTEVISIVCSPDGRWLAASDAAGRIYLWALHGADPATLEYTLARHTRPVVSLSFAPDSATLASVSWDGPIGLWDVAGGFLRQTLPGERGQLSRVAWSPDGRTIACGGYDKAIWLWDCGAARYRAVLRGHPERITALAFSPDSRTLLSGSDDGALRLWDAERAQCTYSIQGSTQAIRDSSWSPDAGQLVIESSDHALFIFDVSAATPPRRLRGRRRVLNGICWSPDGRQIASTELEGGIYIIDAATGEISRELRRPADANDVGSALKWSPDGRWLAVPTRVNGVLLWDMTGSLLVPARRISTPALTMVWSPDGSLLATITDKDELAVWDTEGRLVSRMTQEHAIAPLLWSPDGRLLLVNTRDKLVAGYAVWDLTTGRRVGAFTVPPGSGSMCAWGARDDLVINSSSDGNLRWWNIFSGACVQQADTQHVRWMPIERSHDGTMLLTTNWDGAITLWDLASGAHLGDLRRDRPYERLNISGVRGLTGEQQAALASLGATAQPATVQPSRSV